MSPEADVRTPPPRAPARRPPARPFDLRLRETVSRGRALLVAALATCGVALALVAAGVAIPVWGTVGLVVALVVFAVGATIYEPVALPVLSMPLLTSVYRVGGESVNLSLSDFVLFGVFWIAVVLGPRPYSRAMRTLLWFSAFYQVTTLFTVVANPYRANAVEWCHAYLLVSGALVVGWAVARAGHARAAMTLLVGACLVLALIVLATFAVNLAHGDAGPVFVSWPYGMHKNFEGDVLAIAATVAYARPPWLRWSRAFSGSALVLLLLATAVTQARQAFVGLGVALVILTLRRGQGVRHRRWVLWMVPVGAFFVVRVLHDQLSSGDQFNSAYTRLTWYQESLVVWQVRPWWGVGLRWWYNPWFPHDFQVFQPPQGLLEVLTSAGVVGLVGFLVMNLGMIGTLWRLPAAYGTLGAVVILERFVQGQLDLYWVSVQTSLPFLIAGICVGALAHDEDVGGSPAAAPPALQTAGDPR